VNDPEPSRPRRRRREATPAAPALRAPGTALPAELRPYVTHLQRFRPGNQVVPLRAGTETYPAMLAAIGAARRQVLLETYILDDDRTGNRFAAALRERAGAGVEVKLMFDAVGGLGLDPRWLDALASDGIEVVEFHPIAPWRRRWNLSRRDHRKILVVDDEVAFLGGLNINDDYADVADGGRGWHDMHCRLRGPVVLDLARLFRRTWIYAGGRPYPAPPRAETAPVGPGVPARILENSRRRRKREIRRAYLHAINAARTSIHMENAYFLPDRGVRRALRRAAGRGVDVQVLVPSRSDVKTVEYAALYGYRRLVRHGIQILQWTGAMLHSKTAVVDGVWSAIGTYNFDARSFFYNLEVVAEVLDAELGQAMEAQFARTAAVSVPFDEAAWLALPWWKRAAAWLAFQIRDWL
jgi:cardiolipin synthase A/B